MLQIADADVKRHDHSNEDGEDELDEETMVVECYAAIQEQAVVVHLTQTLVAQFAVLRQNWRNDLKNKNTES